MGRRGEKVKEGFTEEVKPGLGFVDKKEFARQVRSGPEEQHMQEPRGTNRCPAWRTASGSFALGWKMQAGTEQ